MTIKTDQYFGGCPHCGASDGMVNVGKKHLFYCVEHKTMWSPGTNLFSCWKDQTWAEQRKIWDDLGMADFNEVKPIMPENEMIVSFKGVIDAMPSDEPWLDNGG